MLLASCDSNSIDSKLFNGEIRTINDKNVVSKEMKVKPVQLDGEYSGIIAVYDSILICRDCSFFKCRMVMFSMSSRRNILL